MTKLASLENEIDSIGKVTLKAGEPIQVAVSTKDAGGNAHADAVQSMKVEIL